MEALKASLRSWTSLENEIIGGSNKNIFSFQELSYVERGFYSRQISRFLERFGETNLRIIASDSLFSNPVAEFSALQLFLGVPKSSISLDVAPRNAGDYARQDSTELVEAKSFLREVYQTEINTLFAQFGIGRNWM